MLSLSRRIYSTTLIISKRFNSTLTLTTTTTTNESNSLTRDSTPNSTTTTSSTSTTSTSIIQEELKKLLEDNERVRNILLQQYPPTHESPRAPLPVLSITAKKNNTFASISTRDYRVLKSVSAGLLVQGASRGSVEGGSRVGLKIAQLTVDKGVKDLILKLRGFAGRGRDAAVRSILQHPGLNVVSIVEASRVQHGGCKPRKVRRV